MAKKHQRRVIKAEPAVSPGVADGADDLQVLHPEQAITVAGRDITVREYGFIEGLKLQTLYQPLVDDLHEVAVAIDGGDLSLAQLTAMLARHIENVVQLMAVATDVGPEWIAGLSDEDGTYLMHVWWTVNSRFFWQRVRNQIMAQRAAAPRHAGATSTPSSSSTATNPTL